MELKKQLFLIKPRRVLVLGVAFTALLLLGLFFPTLSAFIILPKWMRLPGFTGFLQTSQFKNVDSRGEGIDKIHTVFPNPLLNPKTLIPSSEQEIVLTTNFSSVHDVVALNPSSEQEVVLTRNFSSFHDVGAVNPSSEQEIVLTRNSSSMGDKPDQEKANAPVERYGNSSKEVPTHSSLVTANASFTASTNPPLNLDINGSNTALSKQKIGSGDGKVREDSAVEIVPAHKANEGGAVCNLFDGKWVFDPSYHLYRTRSCSFIDEAFDCEGNGRADLSYMKWRWQPKDCNLPKINATHMLEQLRGKRLVFVGDSINRNQWESMLCLLREAVPDKRRVYETRGRKITKGKGLYTFMFMDYHCTVEFYVTHFLVQEGKARIGRKRRSTLRIDKMDKTSSKWKGADILIFNSAHWWTHSKTAAGVNYYQEGDQVLPRLDVLTAFRRALTTWASWLDTHIDSRKTRVFFRSYSPSHFWGGQWNSGGRCEGQSQPIFNETLLSHYPQQMRIVEEVIEQMKTPVTFLNVTRLSDFRKDGHPSIYGRRFVDKNILNSRGTPQDCSHWCLPGVPDAWNELLSYGVDRLSLCSSQEGALVITNLRPLMWSHQGNMCNLQKSGIAAADPRIEIKVGLFQLSKFDELAFFIEKICCRHSADVTGIVCSHENISGRKLRMKNIPGIVCSHENISGRKLHMKNIPENVKGTKWSEKLCTLLILVHFLYPHFTAPAADYTSDVTISQV